MPFPRKHPQNAIKRAVSFSMRGILGVTPPGGEIFTNGEKSENISTFSAPKAPLIKLLAIFRKKIA